MTLVEIVFVGLIVCWSVVALLCAIAYVMSFRDQPRGWDKSPDEVPDDWPPVRFVESGVLPGYVHRMGRKT